jgi:CheY-like chemotaxis protein
MIALIVEDNDLQSRVLSELLAEEGIDSIIVEDGRKALEALETQSFDIIISDIYMPVVDGLTLLYLCKKDVNLRKIPFVMYSSKPIETDMELAYKLKVSTFVKEAGVRGVIPAVMEILKINQ